MEKYIKPTMEIVKIDAQAAILAGSIGVTGDTVVTPRAPKRYETLSYDAWSEWDESSDEDLSSLEDDGLW